MGNRLDELASYFRPRAEAWLAACSAIGIPLRVIDTGRTMSEQTKKLRDSVSWTQWSKHEPQPPENKSEALDAAPEMILKETEWNPEVKKSWDPKDPLWQQIGVEARKLGLRWGGDWKHINESRKGAGDGTGDPSHIEWLERKDLTK